MVQFTDRYGLALTTASSTAAEAYTEGLDLLLAYQPGFDTAFAKATQEDDAFATARVMEAYLLWLGGYEEEARSASTNAVGLATGATRRERQQARIVAATIGNDKDLVRLLREHLAEFPNDAFVLGLAVFAIGFGPTEPQPMASLHRLLLEVAPAYAGDWWFSGVLALCCEELGYMQEASRLAQRSLDLHPSAAGGAHAMSHVLYETGDHRSAVAFLDAWVDGYDRRAPFRGHLAWHIALSELALDHVDRVERLLAEDIAPPDSPSFTVLEDLSSVLWRQRIYSQGDVTASWDEVCAMADKVPRCPGLSFLHAHAALAYGGADDEASLSSLIAELGTLSEDSLTGSVVIPLAEGIGAFARGEDDKAIRLLEPLQGELIHLGGTHAQREVFEDTLLVAYLGAGRPEPARDLLSGRLAARPSVRDLAWLNSACGP